MTDRTVTYSILAKVNNYLSGMEQVRSATVKSVDAQVKSKKSLDELGASMTQVGTVAAAAGALAAAGIAVVVKAAADYQAKMAQLQTLSKASTAQMKQLSDAAMTQGQAFGYSASQVADAEIELTKAGLSASAILGGALKGALAIAADGQMDVGSATEIATVAMTQFGLSAKDIPHLADLLAAGADKALGSVGDLGDALKNGGLQAHNMGLTIDDTVGTLAAFANQGIIGAEAGTQLRSMFIQLQRPSQQAKETLDEYGISIYDTSGKFIGITKLADELHDKLGGLTQAQRNQALATIFGSHAIVGATALYQDAGTAAEKSGNSIQDWINKVNDSGFADAQAAGKLNSLQGDVQKLSAAFQTDLIKAGSGVDDSLRGVVQTATNLIEVFGAIPEPVQSTVIVLGAAVAGVGLLGGAALIAIPKVVEFEGALKELGVTGKSVAVGFGKGGAVLAGITAVASGLANLGTEGEATTQQISLSASSMQKSFSGINSMFAQAGFANFFTGISSAKDALNASFDSGVNDSGLAKLLDGLTFGITHFSDVYKTNEGQFAAFGQQLAGLSKQNYSSAATSFNELVTKIGGGSSTARELLEAMPAYKEQLIDLAGKAHITASDQNLLTIAQGKGADGAKVAAVAAREAAASASEQAAQIAKLQGSATSATQSVQDLSNAIKGFGSTALDARSADRAFQQAVDDATAAAKKNGATLKDTTQAGRDNAAALDNIASTATALAASLETNGASQAKVTAAISNGRTAYIEQAEAMGLSKTAAAKLADQVGLLPKNVTLLFKTPGLSAANSAASTLQGRINTLVNGQYVVNVRLATTGSVNNSGITAQAHATGGEVTGPGVKGKDSVLTMLAPGEHVLTTSDVDAMGGQRNVYMYRAALHMATGGAVPGHLNAPTAPKSSLLQLVSGVKTDIGIGTTSAIAQATDALATASKQEAAYTRQLAAAKKKLAADTKASTKAEAAYEKARDAAANITGKGNAAAKAAAEKHARELKAAADAAKKTSTTQQKTVDTLSKSLDTAKQTVTDQAARQTALQQDSEDFVSQQRRATADNPIDPLSYVDQLRSMSRDSNYSKADQKKFDAAANKYEASLVDLEDKASKAATALADVKDRSSQLAASVASSIAGGYQASNAGQSATASGWMQRNGIQFQTYTSGVTADSLASYYSQGAADTSTFAGQLKQLAARGYDPALIAEVAGYGVTAGSPIAAALLSATSTQQAAINSGYQSIQSTATSAGQGVADDNYAALIAQDQASSDQITAQIASDGEKLRKLIADAFGLKGYASGTTSATAGLHLVGEQGPELMAFGGGEKVWSAGQTRSYLRGTSTPAGNASITVTAPQVNMPDTITVQDMSGFKQTMRVVAKQEIAADQAEMSVLSWGKSA